MSDRADGAERVGKGHDRAAVQHCRARAKILAHHHPGDDPVRRGADELDAEQVGKGQHLLLDAIEHVHSIGLGSDALPRPRAATIMVMPSLIG